MIQNNFKIAWRSLQKDKLVFSVNVIGLALGIATCLLISLFFIDELSFDLHHEKVDQIYRVNFDAKMGEEVIRESGVMAPIASVFKRELPEVVATTRIVQTTESTKVVYNDKLFRKGKMALADHNIFDVFTFNFVKGNQKTALLSPKSVVLSQTIAEAYFGIEDPINKTIEIKDHGINGKDGYIKLDGFYTVTAVIEDMPKNSHFRFDILSSMSTNPDAENQSWLYGNYHTYVLLEENSEIASVNKKIQSITEKHMSSQLKNALGMTYSEFVAQGNKVGFYLFPLRDIHLHSNCKSEFEPKGNIKIVYMFAAIALFMLFIACINFINLTTASASKRLKEIGIRKVLGSGKSQLAFQFLSEVIIAIILAMSLASIFIFISFPFFNQISGKTFQFNDFLIPEFIYLLLGLTIVITLLAGGYPSLFLAGFNPLQALKNTNTLVSGKNIRSSLVTIQFALTAIMIIAVIVVDQQMQYILNKDIGYDRNQLIVIRQAGLLKNNFATFKEEIKKDPRVENLTTSSFIPAGPTDDYVSIIFPEGNFTRQIRTNVYDIDEEYLSTLGIKILEGRNFTNEYQKEKNKILLNETAVKALDLKGSPIGQTVIEKINQGEENINLTIVGVIKDFHGRSLHEKIEPLILRCDPYYGLMIKTKISDATSLVSTIKKKWDSFGTNEDFNYAFLDELYNETYIKESNMHAILKIFAFLTIFVACLGLFGLVTFTTQQRFKEIGIRKVLGSTIQQIVAMLSKDILKLIGYSYFIAFPIGYLIVINWLQDFEYRIEIKPWVFALAGLITALLAFITISFRSIQAALMNPVNSLKME